MGYFFRGKHENILIGAGQLAGAAGALVALGAVVAEAAFVIIPVSLIFIVELGDQIREGIKSAKAEKVSALLTDEEEEIIKEREEFVRGLVEEYGARAGLPYIPGLEVVPGKSDYYFSADTQDGVVNVSQRALLKGYSEAALRFIIAHEIGHLKTDSYELLMVGHIVGRLAGSFGVLAFAGAFCLAAGVSIAALGAGTAMGMAALTAVMVGAGCVMEVCKLFTKRIMERRADRNAIYLTHDLTGALESMDQMHGPEDRKKVSFWSEMLQTHPTHHPRINAMRKSFETVSKYPQPDIQPIKSGFRLSFGN